MLKKMPLRGKMTLWYSLMTLATVLLFSGVLYFMTAGVLREALEHETRLSLAQVIAQIENENGMLAFENQIPIDAGKMYFVTEENGSELASLGEDITLFDKVPVQPDVFRYVAGPAERWLLLDSGLVRVDQFTLRVRVASSCAQQDRVLSSLLRLILIGVPLMLLAALLGGNIIAKRSLKPVRQIIQSAEAIAEGDLSARIPPTPVKDELGELTDTLNNMLESVETGFKREQRFTSDASHELRTPVAVVRTYAETLLAQEANDERRAYLQTILNETANMKRIIGQLLIFSRGVEGRQPLQKESVSLREMFEGIADSLADSLKEAQITLQTDVPESLTLRADQSLLTQALLNLAENAIKYGRENGHVTLSGRRAGKDIRLLVGDDGIGIAPEALPHIFERFYRVDAARDRSGTGLGLSIVDWIVKAHGGKIQVRSEPGKGSEFILTLPS